MNKNIAKAMGMAEPERETYEVAGREVESEVVTTGDVVQAGTPALPDMAEDDNRIRTGDRNVDDLIAEGMVALREAFNEAGNMEPKSKARQREVGAQIMAVTLQAIKHKQDFAVRNKQQRMKEASWGSNVPSSISNTQINNIVASRNDIMKMLDGDKKEEPGE